MATYRRSTRVAAPLSAVWSFHASVEGLLALTPDWLGLRVESVRGPEGTPEPGELGTGTRIRLSMRPLGVGPRLGWTSRIVERERGDGSAVFRDEMLDGPFPRWVHTHRFEAADGATEVTDSVEYELPLVPAGAATLGRPGFELLFAYRHHRTRQLLGRDRP